MICGEAEGKISWADLQADKPTIKWSKRYVATELHPIRDAPEPAFYDLYEGPEEFRDPSFSAIEDPETVSDFEQAWPHRRREWDAILKRPERLQPKPNSHYKRFSMVVLYHMTPTGPDEIAHWPVAGMDADTPRVKADGPYIFSTSLDGKFVDVHSTTTGEILRQIPIPDSSAYTEWQADRYSVTFGTARKSYVFDVQSGLPLVVDPSNPLGLGLMRAGDRYLTIASQDSSTYIGYPNSWPLRAQVREFPSGQLLANHRLAFEVSIPTTSPGSVRLTPDGQQIIVETDNERILKLDALSGNVLETIEEATWPNFVGVLSILVLILWIVAWIRTADRVEQPRVVTMLVVTGVVVIFLLMRLELSGNPYEPHRPANILLIAMVFSWNIELMQHLFRPGASWWSQIVAVVPFLAVIATLVLSLFSHYRTFEVVLFLSIFNVCLSAFYVMLRLMKRLPGYSPVEPTRSQFSMRTILVATTLVACAASWIYRLPRYERAFFTNYPEMMWLFLTFGSLVAFGLLCRNVLWFRWLGLAATIVAVSLMLIFP